MEGSSINTGRYRDLEGRRGQPWGRRFVLLLFTAFLVSALAGLVGQRDETSVADSPAARLEMKSPSRLRGGLLFQTKFTITAKQNLAKPRLVLNAGHLDGFTLNTAEPSSPQELNRNGELVLTYNSLGAGEKLVVWLDYQVNPTTLGSRTQIAQLEDGDSPLARVTRKAVVLP